MLKTKEFCLSVSSKWSIFKGQKARTYKERSNPAVCGMSQGQERGTQNSSLEYSLQQVLDMGQLQNFSQWPFSMRLSAPKQCKRAVPGEACLNHREHKLGFLNRLSDEKNAPLSAPNGKMVHNQWLGARTDNKY